MSNIVRKKVGKNTEFNTRNTKINNLENNIPVALTLIQSNQCDTEKEGYFNKKYLMLIGYWLQLFSTLKKLEKMRKKKKIHVIH